MNITLIQCLGDIGINNNLFIKRDDLFPISFGGNKARKAILFFEDMKKLNSDCVVTYGSSSSNHCRVVANIAASKKMPCYIISPIESNNETTNSKMIKLFDSKIIKCPVSKIKETIDNKMKELKCGGLNPYFIEGGGHGNIGTKAYVYVYEEIRNYEIDNNIFFDFIFHASGTGTTQAGLICGKLINNDCKEIIGISIARKNPHGEQIVLDSVNSYMNSIDKEVITSKEIKFLDSYIFDGYGSYNNKIKETVKQMLVKEGIPFDTTYTGKAFWGMKEYLKKSEIAGKNILFIHTGGTPLFFDDLEELII